MNKQILRLAIPNIVSNLSVPLLGVVDTAVVGRLEHVYYLGAIAVGSIIFDFIFWGFGFLRMGTTGLVAQAFGASNNAETRFILYRVLLVATAASALLIAAQLPIIKLALHMFNASSEVEQYAQTYFHIRIFAAPATLSLFALNGWFLGMQNARFPMIITIVLNVLNIILNLILVLGFKLNVSGVAWGTLISSYVAAGFAWYLFTNKYRGMGAKASFTDLLNPAELKKFFSVNRDIFIRTLGLIFTYAFFVAKSAETGDVVLAANTILLQFWYISAYAVDGFAFAAESLAGRFVGAKNPEKLVETVKFSMFWGLGLGLVGTLAYWVLGEQILLLFTDKPMVLQAAGMVLVWTIAAPLVNSICFIWDGVFIGATATEAMRNSMLLATIIFFVPVYYLAKPVLGVHAIWLAMTTFMVVRGLTLSFMAPKHIFKKLKTAGVS